MAAPLYTAEEYARLTPAQKAEVRRTGKRLPEQATVSAGPVGRAAPRTVGADGKPRTAATPDPAAQLQDIYDTWDKDTEFENQAWYNNERQLNLQQTGNQRDWESGMRTQLDALGGLYGQATANDLASLGAYQQAGQTYTNSLNGALGTYNQRANDLYNTQVPMLTASQWQSSAQDIGNQNQALSQFGDIYGGALDYQSQGAQAYADPATIAEQWNVYGQLQGAAGGSLDTVSQAALANASPEARARHVAAVEQLGGLVEGGEWADQQRQVTQKYKDLTDPEITAQERFILTEFQQRREDQERAARDASMSSLAARGLRSGAAEQTAMGQAQSELGRQSVLSELGAQANAIARSQQAMQGWSNSANAGRTSQLQAAGLYTDAAGNLRSQEFDEAYSKGLAADQTAIANANRQLQAMGMSAQQINEMRNASFNEAYSRGVAADNASANNQATRLSGANSYASQANTMRAQNDAVGTFNVGQQNLVGMNNQQVQLADLNRRGGINQSQMDTNRGVASDIYGVGTNNFNASRGVTADAVGRGERLVGAEIGFVGGTRAGRDAVVEAERDTGRQRQGVFTDTIDKRASAGSALTANQTAIRRGLMSPTG